MTQQLPNPRHDLCALLPAVFAGGAIGALARTSMSLAADMSPWVTLAENTVGCLLLGTLLGALHRVHVPPWLVSGLGTGLLASFTSMSAFSADLTALLIASPLAAFTYIASSILGGLAAAALGIRIGRSAFSRRSQETP